MAEPVVVVDYDPAWRALFDEEKARLSAAIGHLVADVQHVGATSVPGCGGKPAIDIMVGVSDLAVGEQCIQPLADLGYEYKGEQGIPGRLYFGKGQPRTHRLHMVRTDGDFWRDLILFRDYLRAHPETAEEYYRLKKELASRFGADREGYTGAKTPFIQAVLAEARAGPGRPSRTAKSQP